LGARDKYGFKLSDIKVLPLQSLSNVAAALKGETRRWPCCRLDAALADGRKWPRSCSAGVGDETPWQLGRGIRLAEDIDHRTLVTKLLGALVRADANITT